MNSTLSRYGSNYSQEIHDGRDVYQTADFIRIYSRKLRIAPPHAPAFPPRVREDTSFQPSKQDTQKQDATM